MRRSTLWLAALALDALVGEPPPAIHPVVAAGRLIAALKHRAPAAPGAAVRNGVALVALPVGLALAGGWLAERLRPAPLRLAATVFLLKSSFALRALIDAGRRAEAALAQGDPAAARVELAALVSRPTDTLDEARLASAIVESLAENLSDSYVAPLCWYALGGLPAALAYRVVNTADAMVGYHGRYEYLGKPAARLDDVANLVPARLTAAALVAAAPLAGGSARRALHVLARDHRRTESPNAGWPMAGAAGALGVWLEKPGTYRLGAGGRAPEVDDAAAARRLVLAAAGIVTLAFVLVDRRRGRA
ncbi:MAG: cobalamin biosynthesis protein CobD [Anaerolinea sp.]|nr:cobalamin biosynthesis protein CobD [Anaerolinea sp.]